MSSVVFQPRTFVRGFFSACLALVPCLAIAGGFQVAPTIAEVAPGTHVASLELRNNGDQPVTVQVDALAWSQSAAAGDRLDPATGVVVVPRIATLAPHASQLVRVAVQGDSAQERAYRLRMREVPPPPPPGFMGVRTLVEQLVPVFFQTEGSDTVDWTLHTQQSGALTLAATNSGTRHLALANVRVVDAHGAVLAERKGPGYVLAGQSVQWSLDAHARPRHGDAVRLEFLSHGAPQAVPLHVE
jgi:fimbrial chaperone protein